MVTIAKTRGVRERRDRDGTIAAYRGGMGWVRMADDEWPTRSGAVTPCPQTPEGATLAGELLAVIRCEIVALLDLQRAVITLRAVLDVGYRDVCDRLGLSTVLPTGIASPRPQGSAPRAPRLCDGRPVRVGSSASGCGTDMTKDLVIVLAVAAVIPLLLGLMPRIAIPGAFVEIIAGVVIGPTVLGWVHPDDVIRALSVLGLSFLLFLGGFEVDVRCFRGRTGHHVLLTLAGSLVLAAGVGATLAVAGVRGGLLVAISLLATWSGPVVATLTRAGLRERRVGELTVACASGGAMAAVVTLSVGVAGAHTPLAGRLLPLGLLLVLLGVIGGVVWGAEHVGRVEALVDQLSDTSAQIRIRLTVLLVAGVALAAFGLGFEAVLGAFLAGVLVRTLDPEPEVSHPHYPIKLEAVGFGLLIPVFFINSGVTVDVKGLLEDPRALVGVPLLIIALLVVRGLPIVSLRRDLPGRNLPAVALLQATSLPFLLTVAQVGIRMGLIDRTTAAALIAAGIVSVLLFPPLALQLLKPVGDPPDGGSAAAIDE